MRIHHRNLATFVGYCDDDDKLALIYEYMPNGNLKRYLSGTSDFKVLSYHQNYNTTDFFSSHNVRAISHVLDDGQIDMNY